MVRRRGGGGSSSSARGAASPDRRRAGATADGVCCVQMTTHEPATPVDAALSQLCCRTALRQPPAGRCGTAWPWPGTPLIAALRTRARATSQTGMVGDRDVVSGVRGVGGMCRNGTEMRSRGPWRAGQQGRCPARCIRMLPFRCDGQAVRGVAVQWRSARLPGLPGPWARNTVGRDCDVWSPATAVRLLPCPAGGGLTLPVRKGL